MNLSSMAFLAGFLPVALVVYWVFRKNVFLQNMILLTEGLVFYGFFDWKYPIILLGIIVITYFAGISSKRILQMSGICAILLLLAFFKYTGMLVEGIFLPTGMSFFAFSAAGYLFDIKYKKYVPEKNIMSVALFLCFFPVIIAGPILRYPDMESQIKNRRTIDFSHFEKAVLVFTYGLFLKLVIADRIAIFVNNVYDTYRECSGQILFLGAVAYSLQIYADFAGYSYMAAAVATLLGFEIPENFRQPYFAVSIADFWHRWHISLSSWLRDYVYIPMGGNRKGEKRKYLNTIITFFISGVWHGVGLNYLAWGLLHGMGQVIGSRFKGVFSRIGKTVPYRVWRSVVTFLIVSLLWIFFRADSLLTALSYIKHMITESRPWELTDGTLFSFGIDGMQMFLLFVFVLLMVVVSLIREKYGNSDIFLKQNVLIKCAGVLALLIIISCFGCYGIASEESSFIYMAF